MIPAVAKKIGKRKGKAYGRTSNKKRTPANRGTRRAIKKDVKGSYDVD